MNATLLLQKLKLADISQLPEEFSKTRDLIVRLEDAKTSESKSAKGLDEIKKIIFSFPAFIESGAYEENKGSVRRFFVGGYLSPGFLTDTRKPQMCNRDRDSKYHSFACRSSTSDCV